VEREGPASLLTVQQYGRNLSSVIAHSSSNFATHVPLLLPLLVFIIFVQGIYNFILEANHVSKVYSVAAIL
jgi:hypothetical protein